MRHVYCLAEQLKAAENKFDKSIISGKRTFSFFVRTILKIT